MTANHAPGCPAIADPRDGCSCLLRQTSSTGPASSYPPPRVLPTSRGPGEEREYGALDSFRDKSIQRWTYDADVGVCRRLNDGNYGFLPHREEVVIYVDHVAAVAAAREDERGKWEPMVQALTDELLIKAQPDVSMGAQYLAGRSAGLDAARDAVGAELDSYRADCINDNKIISLIAVDTFRHTMRTIAAARGEQQWVR